MYEGSHVDRYVLGVLVSSTGTIQVWQGWDPALERYVSVRLIPLSDPRAPLAAQAARQAATVDERRLVGVLDVMDAVRLGDADYVAIVNEWVEGTNLADLYEDREGEPIDAPEALTLVHQVALAVLASQSQGVPHGRLRPASLLLADAPFDLVDLASDADSVRIRGLAVDAVLWPRPALPFPDVEAPPVDSDVHGVGCLLYAAVTGRWPEGLVDGMSPAPRSGDRLLPPSQVVAAVPPVVDALCMRAIDPRVSGDWPAKRGRAPYADLAALATALGAALGSRPRRDQWASEADLDDEPRPMSAGRRAARAVARLAVAAAALTIVGGVGFLGFQIANSAASPAGTR